MAHQAASAPAEVAPVRRRLLSLDALRGFDMFWITGGDAVVHALAKAAPIAPFLFLKEQMDHKDWEGFAFYDLIFPLFVFMVGVSIVFSLSRAVETGGRRAAFKRILTRSIILYLFGLLIYGGISKGFDNVRWLGVLQRIAICYFAASLAFCTFRTKGLVALCTGLLVGYWALVTFVPVRDFDLTKANLARLHLTPTAPETLQSFLATTSRVSGRFDDGLNLPNHIDFLYLPGYKWDGAYDPEGLLSTFPAIATCLLGVLAGLWLRNSSASDQLKVFVLLIAGAIGVAAGFLWGLQFPVIKKIWTSSYVLVAGGYSCLLLGTFYQVIEVWGIRRWCIPFVWIGMNAITMYIFVHVVDLAKISSYFAGGPVQQWAGAGGELLIALVSLGLVLLLARFLYSRGIFLKV